ncbi:MAG: hypothetical protein GX811_12785 [Lentisphaerae bacterium]|nr:hypothetical protein [Lentisphaerota bacterium]
MKKVKLKCPRCGRRVIDANVEVESELREITEESDWEADYFGKCKSCGAEVGIKKLNTDLLRT